MTVLHAELLPDGTCVLRSGDTERWRAHLDLGDAATWNPFREAVVWPSARLVVAAAGDHVHLLDLDTGDLRTTLALQPDHFGHLALIELSEAGTTSTTELLLVLGWTGARAYAPPGTLRWHAPDLAVDGLTFESLEGSILRLHAEMDPPGGWFAVSLDATTGRELSRAPAFLPGYCGLYGEAPEEPTGSPSSSDPS